jgi:photosystem II stability/assembly factor-like uncharacterized protein
VLFALYGQSIAQWTKANGPYSRTIASCFTAYENNLYAGSESYGVFLSTDSGSTWQAIGNELPYRDVISLVRTDSILLAGTYHGLYGSTDNGLNWDRLKTGIPINRRVHALVVFDNVLLAGTDYASIYRSTDNGGTWTQVRSAPMNWETVGFAAQGGRYLAAIYNEGLFSSEDSGKTWQPLPSQIPPGTIRSLAVHNEIIFAGSLFSSPDSGITWHKSDEGITETVRNLISVGPYIFVGTVGDGVFRSADNGKTWWAVNEGLASLDIGDIFDFGTRLFVSTSIGVFVSTDFGESWQKIELRFTETTVNALMSDGDNFYAGTYHGIFKSPDKGATWTEINNGLNNFNIHALLKNGPSLYAATEAGLYYSRDDGLLWQYADLNSTELYISSLAKNDSTVFAANSANVVFASSDDGLSWKPITLSSQPPIRGRGIRSLAADNANLFIGTTSFGAYHLDLEKNELTNIDPLREMPIQALYIDDRYLYAGTDEGVFLSTDNGESWTEMNNGIPDYWWYGITVAAIAGNDEAIVVATYNTVAISWDRGANWRGWKVYDEGYPSQTNSVAVLYQDSTIYIGTTFNGVWSYKIPAEITAIENPSPEISQYSLKQNYPNPFNPATTISFDLPKAGWVTVAIYNIAGKRVQTLLDTDYPAGSHSITFDASEFGSGIYFYELKTKAYSSVRKMLLIK